MRVLIAHRDEASRTMLTEAVDRGRPGPLDVVHAGEGSDALDLLLHDDPPEVALIDWDLPGIEGPEMCRLVRDFHHGRDTWIVVLAGPEHEDTADAWRAGARDCVAMPAPASVVADAVTRAVCGLAPEGEPAGSAAPQPPAASATPQPPASSVATKRVAPPRPTLDAVCAPDAASTFDGEVPNDGFAELTADLQATLNADHDTGLPAELAAGPARLCARRVDLDDDASRGRASLDALLARL